MFKLLAGCAAVTVTAFVMLPASAGAVEQRADSSMRTSNSIEVSSVRRYRRYGYAPRYYARRAYAEPYYAEPYYDRPYGYGWGPAPFPFVLGLPY